jgi:integration host factor subunit beta
MLKSLVETKRKDDSYSKDQKNMTKADLINVISEKAGITRVKAETVVNTIFDSMIEALKRGDRIEIRGFGSFVNREYDAYKGRNPRTGEVIEVNKKRLPFFKVGKELKEEINAQIGKPMPEVDD